ncbi:MAG: hypothetical protein MHM6MM_004435 [Cercozoa sp. M6MM]
MINTAPYTTLLVAQCSTFGPMKCVITVGTTKFDDLVRALDEGAEVFVSAIVGYGIDELIIQHGASERPSRLVSEATRQSLRVTCFDYDSRVPEMLSTATLVVCHAGAGTLLETLRAPTRPHCVCVVNTTLQNNHQTELADTLSEACTSRAIMWSHWNQASFTPRSFHLLLTRKELSSCMRRLSHCRSRSKVVSPPLSTPWRFRCFPSPNQRSVTLAHTTT